MGTPDHGRGSFGRFQMFTKPTCVRIDGMMTDRLLRAAERR
jgi:hypothetical protein